MTAVKFVSDVVSLYQSSLHDIRVASLGFLDLDLLVKDVLKGWGADGCNLMYLYDPTGQHLLAFGTMRNIDTHNKNVHVSRIVALRPDYLTQLLEAFEHAYPGYSVTAYRRGYLRLFSVSELKRFTRYARLRSIS